MTSSAGKGHLLRWDGVAPSAGKQLPYYLNGCGLQPASDVGFRQQVDVVGKALTSETATLTSREGGPPFRRVSAFRKLERTRIPDETGEQNLGTVNENVALASAGPAPNGPGDAREPACDPNEQRLW